MLLQQQKAEDEGMRQQVKAIKSKAGGYLPASPEIEERKQEVQGKRKESSHSRFQRRQEALTLRQERRAGV